MTGTLVGFLCGVALVILTAALMHFRTLAAERGALVKRLDEDLAQLRKDAAAERLSLTRRMDFERGEMRREIRRLTKALVVLKREHPHVLPPEHTDERWGSYVISTETEMAEQERRKREDEAHEAVREVDRELLGQIEGELSDI